MPGNGNLLSENENTMNELQDFMYFWSQAFMHVAVRYVLIAGGMYLLFYVFLRQRHKWVKIQAKYPKTKQVMRETLFSLQTTLIFAVQFALFLFVFRNYTLIYEHISEYGIPYYLLTIVLMFFIHDTYFYWMHRLIHHPKLYRKVHLVHHQSVNPTPFASYSFHWVESILEGMIIPLIVFVLPVHPSALILFLLGQFMINVYGHLGFELFPRGFNRTWIGRWINTSVAHNQHHEHFTGNYGLYFLFWDRWMGTLRQDYDVAYENAQKLSDYGKLQRNKPETVE